MFTSPNQEKKIFVLMTNILLWIAQKQDPRFISQTKNYVRLFISKYSTRKYTREPSGRFDTHTFTDWFQSTPSLTIKDKTDVIGDKISKVLTYLA